MIFKYLVIASTQVEIIKKEYALLAAMQCDICGNKEATIVASIEGAALNVCSGCGKFGKFLRTISAAQKAPKPAIKAPTIPEKEVMDMLIEDYAACIRQAREKLGLKQEDFAKKINEKVSLIHHIETGRHEPSIELARKLERFLRIKLVVEHEEVHDKAKKEAKGESFTLGDFIKIKKG